jgi:hypothetical protein
VLAQDRCENVNLNGALRFGVLLVASRAAPKTQHYRQVIYLISEAVFAQNRCENVYPDGMLRFGGLLVASPVVPKSQHYMQVDILFVIDSMA